MRRLISSVKLTPTDLPLVLFLLSALLALIPAYDRRLAWPSLAALLLGGVLYALISRASSPRPSLHRFAKVSILFAGLAALFLISQYSHSLNSDKIAVISRLTSWIGQFTPRLSLWTPQANSLATLLEGLVFLAAALLFLEKKPVWRLGLGLSLAVICLGLLLSESRGAWLAIALVGLTWLAVRYRWARWLAVLTVLAGAGLVLAVLISGDIQILDRIPLVNRTLAPLFIRPDRLDVYRGSLYLIQDMPFSGIGLGGQFAMVYSRFGLLIRVPFLTYSHNLFMETWLELGLLGFLAWTFLLAGLFWPAAAAPRVERDLLYESTWIGLLAMVLHGLTDARPFVDLWCWAPFFLLLGLNAALWLHKNQGPVNPGVFKGPLTFTVFVLLFLAAAIPLVPAAWLANQGGLEQTRAELSPGLDDAQRAVLLESAQGHFQQSIAMRESQRSAHFRLGLILTQKMQFLDAIDHLEMANSYDPTNAGTRKALGLAYAWSGYLVQARGQLQNIPDITEELNTWGWWWGQQKRDDLARRAYQVSLLIAPDQPVVQQVLDALPVDR